MTPSARVVITHPRGRLETRSGVLYDELLPMMVEIALAGDHAVAYRHDHRHGDPIVGEAFPGNAGTTWAEIAPPLRDNVSRASYPTTNGS